MKLIKRGQGSIVNDLKMLNACFMYGHVGTVNKEMCYRIFAVVNFYTHGTNLTNKQESIN